MAEEVEVEARAVERWTLTLPRPGGPTADPIQGTPVFSFELFEEEGDHLERTLRSETLSVRRGRPLVYRGDRRIVAAREEEDEPVVRTQVQSPDAAAAMFEVAQLRDVRRTLIVECDARRKEQERLDQRLEETRGLVQAERERQERELERVTAHGRGLVAEAQAHYEKQLRAVWRVEEDLDAHASASLQQIGQQVGIATAARAQIDKVMRAEGWGQLLSGLKENVEAAANSQVGNAISMHVAARLAAMVSERLERRQPGAPRVTTEDALVAMVLQGRAHRLRRSQLAELLQVTNTTPASDAVRATDGFLAGELEFRVLARQLQPREG